MDTSNFIPNFDGGYTDPLTGFQYDANFNFVSDPTQIDGTGAVPSAALFTTPASAIAPNTTPAVGGSATLLSAGDDLLSTIESAWTNLAQPLVSAGLISTPASTAAAASSAAATAAIQQANAAKTTQTNYVLIGGIILAALLIWRETHK